MKVSILGTGKIGTDLLYKILKIPEYEIVAFVGRRDVIKNIPTNVTYYSNGINFFIDNPKSCDIVFDCTDAYSARENSKVFRKQGIYTIDLTPSKIGRLCVPNINCDCLHNIDNVNMVTCGGQVSLPLLKYLKSKCNISYAEVVSQISSDTAGMATRINIDKYIETTESAIQTLIGINKCKVILNVNPFPKTVMQTTIFIKTNQKVIFEDYDLFIKKTQKYINGYTSDVRPIYIKDNIVMVSVKVYGSEDYLSKYAGNLDVINCAAIEVSKKIFHIRSDKVDIRKNVYERILDV
jgi:acetaldehyde dehydrogenase|tara:strand:+ start:985 stop:1866 length:882 start_codon:yes stop_codon:yes gene_type:complete